MTQQRKRRKGQALLLVTLSLFAMCGLLGLAVDLGWSYFVKKSAQNAADAAALAVAHQQLRAFGETATVSPTETGGDCDLSGNLQTGCMYAGKNDFRPGGHGGRQNVNIMPDQLALTRQDGSTVPLCASPVFVGCVEYKVTVRTVEAIPQLFSAVMGNATALTSARATAGIVQARVNGSLITLNRANDNFGPNPGGIAITPTPVTATNGVTISTNIQSGTVVNGPLMALSTVTNPGTGSPFQNRVDGPQFLDPLRGYGQPPLPTTALNTYAVIGGNMSGATGGVYQFIANSNAVNTTQPIAVGGTAVLPSGNYVPGIFGPGCILGGICLVDLGSPQLNITGTVTFSDSAPFGYYFFFGGLNVPSGGKMIMGPGEYVLVGGGNGGNDLSTVSGAAVDGTGGTGAIIIRTGSSGSFTVDLNTNTATGPADLYPNLITQINSNKFMVTMAANNQLSFAPMSLLAPQDVAGAPVTGLDPSNSALPQGLVPFGGIVMWQDQANSGVLYTTPANTPPAYPGSGYVDIFSCNGTMANPCSKALQNVNSPGINVQMQQALGFNGTIYQPRGAWINVGPGTLSGPIQLVTGSVAGNPGSAMSLTPPTTPLRRRIVALIE